MADHEQAPLSPVPKGATCAHTRSRVVPCRECAKTGRYCAQLECLDCDFVWDLLEDPNGQD